MTNMFMTEESVDLLNSICAGRPVEFAAEFTTCIPQIIETVGKDVLSKQWVDANDKKPELFTQNDSDCLQSKEVFFELSHWGQSGAMYHGWYIARPVEKEDRHSCHHCDCDVDCEEDEDTEYEYFFSANVGDELFDEDSIKRWMFVPERQES